MISVIIPTLWRSPYIGELLHQLEEVKSVSEVILIDNRPKASFDTTRFDKVVRIVNSVNNYVSPSWNQGYEASTQKNICLLNDDVILPHNVFDLVDSFLSRNIGIIGLLSDVYENILSDTSSLGRAEGMRLTLCTKRNFGYGCCMFMHRDNYRLIPEELRIQYGDDFLFYSCDKNNFVIDGFSIVGKLSGSLYDENLQLIDRENVSAICTQDHNFFWDTCAPKILSREPVSDLDRMKLEELKAYEIKSRDNYYF